jgi:hypothetical protein
MKALRMLYSITLGAACGAFLHYLLFRFGLPLEPFIYVSF